MFNARVVDAETGEPLEVAVVIVWFRQTYIPLCMDSCSVLPGKGSCDQCQGKLLTRLQGFSHSLFIIVMSPSLSQDKPVAGITLNHTDVLLNPRL
jgi:hypothetical protein